MYIEQLINWSVKEVNKNVYHLQAVFIIVLLLYIFYIPTLEQLHHGETINPNCCNYVLK